MLRMNSEMGLQLLFIDLKQIFYSILTVNQMADGTFGFSDISKSMQSRFVAYNILVSYFFPPIVLLKFQML